MADEHAAEHVAEERRWPRWVLIVLVLVALVGGIITWQVLTRVGG